MEGPLLLRDPPRDGRQPNEVQAGAFFANHGAENPAHKLVGTECSGELHERSFCWLQATPARPIGMKLVLASGDGCGAPSAQIVVEAVQEELNAVLEERRLFHQAVHEAIELRVRLESSNTANMGTLSSPLTSFTSQMSK
jgi:hypothetical protein